MMLRWVNARCAGLMRRGEVAVVVGQRASVERGAGDVGIRDEMKRYVSQETCAALASRQYMLHGDARSRSGIGCGKSTTTITGAWMRSMSAASASAAKKNKRQKQRGGSHTDDDDHLDIDAASGSGSGDDGFGTTESLEAILPRLESKVEDAIDAMDERLRQLRTGIAHPSLLSHIVVECYGTTMSIQDVAAVSVSDKRVLSVNVFDASVVKNVESAIMKANLGLQPIVGGGGDNSSGGGGGVIRVPVPVLDSDGKKELLKVVSKIGETTKVQIRGHRKDAMQAIKKLASSAPEDDKRTAEKNVQKIIDDSLVVVSNAIALKQKEL